MATPPPTASSRYFTDVKDGARRKSILVERVMSLKVMGDCACGAGGGGFLFGVSEL